MVLPDAGQAREQHRGRLLAVTRGPFRDAVTWLASVSGHQADRLGVPVIDADRRAWTGRGSCRPRRCALVMRSMTMKPPVPRLRR